MNLGFSEMFFLVLLALILFGPRRLPEIARQLGKFMAEFKRASNEFQNQINDEIRKLDSEEQQSKSIAPGAGQIVGSTNSISSALDKLTDRLKSFPQDYDA